MTRVIDLALAEVAKLPEAEQDALASFLQDEIKSEQKRATSLAASQDPLQSLAEEALAELREGRSRPQDHSL